MINLKKMTIIILSLLIFGGGFFIYKRRIPLIDYSIEKSFVHGRKYKVHLVTYSAGSEVHFRNQNALIQTAINKGFDVFHAYNEKNLDNSFKEKNKKIFDLKRGAGYWIWKPYVILDALKHANDGDIIFYIDSGTILKNNITDFLNLFDSIEKDIFVMNGLHNNEKYMKRDLLRHFDMDNTDTRKNIQMDASIFIVRKSENSEKFLTQWLHLCEKEELLTDSPSKDEYPEFLDHRHDQAILTLLCYKNKNIVFFMDRNIDKKTLKHHRRRDDKKHVSLY